MPLIIIYNVTECVLYYNRYLPNLDPLSKYRYFDYLCTNIQPMERFKLPICKDSLINNKNIWQLLDNSFSYGLLLLAVLLSIKKYMQF